MDGHGDNKAPHPHLLDSQDEEQHHADAPGLPSYQEATSGTRQPPPSYFHPDTTHTPGAGSTTTTTYPDEKARPYGHDDASPRAAAVPSSSQQPASALTFIISLQNASVLLHKKIAIRPAGCLANIGWEVEYASKYRAAVNRFEVPGAGQQQRAEEEEEKAARAQPEDMRGFPREVAALKYPEFIVPGWCGVTVTFLPKHHVHDAVGTGMELEMGVEERKPTKRFMHCTGVMSTKYAMEFPELGGGASSSSQAAAAAAGFDLSSLFPNNWNNWTPFLTQYLVDEAEEKHVLAQYTRSAPWASERGILKIFPQNGREEGGAKTQFEDPVFIEEIVIACAAMVGMQDRLGMVSSLVEAGAEAYAGKGKGRA
ncbi:uncharacterized protein PG986_004678 [Apiospora aurea]|uniref:Uncharacterized protein n=1 Tax=Apiospora aurea TaxID=335848 RepID=A0ABR1QN97_9PEZI